MNPPALDPPVFLPDFTEDCYVCGTSPTVSIPSHEVPDTRLCGVHFFSDQRMADHELWNDPPADLALPAV